MGVLCVAVAVSGCSLRCLIERRLISIVEHHNPFVAVLPVHATSRRWRVGA